MASSAEVAESGKPVRKGSWINAFDRHTEEDEFFHSHQQHQRKGSLAGIAAQKVLVRHLLGSITFADVALEREWRRCAVRGFCAQCILSY